jgi:hypothetical protein
MKKLLFSMGLVGALFCLPALAVGEDLFGIAANPIGADRYTETVYGYNNSVAGTEESIWDGDDASGAANGPVRCFANMNTAGVPTAAALYISSDDEDDASDGTGEVVVTVEALDANWDPVTIVAPLGIASAGGTVFAQIGSATLMRVNRAYVSSATNAFPEGNIYIGLDSADGGTDGIPDTIATDHVAQIAIGAGQTRQACYSVPNNYDAYLTEFCISDLATGAAATVFRLRSSVEGAIAQVELQLDIADGGERCHTFSPPMRFAEKTDIEFTGTSTADNSAASFSLVLIDDTKPGLGRE